EFQLGTDALNYWRLRWRCGEEWGTFGFGEPFEEKVRAKLCAKRSYDPDEFASALEATKGRARLPFGWTALDFALHRAKSAPIRLLSPELKGRVPTLIANIAFQLQEIQQAKSILLPIDQLRIVLGLRKLVVSGTVLRLIQAGIIEYTD